MRNVSRIEISQGTQIVECGCMSWKVVFGEMGEDWFKRFRDMGKKLGSIKLEVKEDST
jgi:hypothetical protein